MPAFEARALAKMQLMQGLQQLQHQMPAHPQHWPRWQDQPLQQGEELE